MSEPLHGTLQERFAPLRREFERRLASGDELGASLAVVIDGQPVVDLWGGFADAARTRPWQSDTITNVWSTTKTVTALAALMLVDRGELDLDAPVAHYWPEFSANGKSDIPVRSILGHTSGVSGWEAPITVEALYDQEKAAALLAAQAPWWPPGTASGYHLIDYGHLVGELVRRITGRSLGAFVRTEITGPLGADFHIGLADSELPRVSDIIPPPPAKIDLSRLPRDHPAWRTLTNPPLNASSALTAHWRRAELGGANGHGNARSVARIQSIVSNRGEVDGVRLLSEATIERILEQQSDGPDLVLLVPLRFGIGFALPRPETTPSVPPGRVAFWGGWGGSLIINDLDRGMTFAYVMNRMSPGIIGSERSDAYLDALYESLRA